LNSTKIVNGIVISDGYDVDVFAESFLYD